MREPASPFLKWPGGKRKLVGKLRGLLPSAVDELRYIEPFLGGGALFFDQRPCDGLLSDINPDLVLTYLAVRDELEAVLSSLARLAQRHSELAYYQVREAYNRHAAPTGTERAAQFLYLNKTCFNGVYRVNRRGEFNVPCGAYDRPNIADETALRRASLCLADTTLQCASFESAVAQAGDGDFIYFDPPYWPASRTANFTAYSPQGFGPKDQARLREVFGELDRRGAKVMLSNSDVESVRELYRGYNVTEVNAPRAVNSNPKARGAVRELVIRNYS